MTRSTPVRWLASLAAIALSTAALADEGMWLLTRPPIDQLTSRFAFTPSHQWLEHVQKSCVRIGFGGSGSFVSSRGLIMTNHHVGSDAIADLSTAEHDYAENGFYAPTLDKELKCPRTEIMVLWAIQDVTDRVTAAAAPDMTAADIGAAQRKAMTAIEKEAQDATGLRSTVVTLYHGARFHLYQYRRYTDIRLVFAPEQQAAAFGGDTDNFEYPRYGLDMAFFRVYEDGKPLETEHHLAWSPAGSQEGDLALVFGHPGRTSRLLTMAHLEFMRDVELPFRLAQLWRAEVKLQGFSDRNTENARIAKEDLDGAANSRKAFTGQLAALQDPALMARKNAAELSLRAAVNADAAKKARWASAWDDVARAQEVAREIHIRRALLESLFRSALAGRAHRLVQLADELAKPSADRLREYRDSNLDSINLSLYSTAPIYAELETFRLAGALSHACEALGADDPLVRTALAGKSPAARAAELVAGTTLADVGARKAVADGGAAAIASSTDAMILFARSLDAEWRALRTRHDDEVDSVERDAYARIAAAMFDSAGEGRYPDATGTLRLSFGGVSAYQEDGRAVPAYTTIAGLFDRAASRPGQAAFALTPRWSDARGRLRLDTPYNFVCTADVIGGNSGSPVVNSRAEVIGLIFDGNIHSLGGRFAYDDALGRSVALDSRAIVEALRAVYRADPLIQELTASGQH